MISHDAKERLLSEEADYLRRQLIVLQALDNLAESNPSLEESYADLVDTRETIDDAFTKFRRIIADICSDNSISEHIRIIRMYRIERPSFLSRREFSQEVARISMILEKRLEGKRVSERICAELEHFLSVMGHLVDPPQKEQSRIWKWLKHLGSAVTGSALTALGIWLYSYRAKAKLEQAKKERKQLEE